ncbi:MAG TPA: TetR/AcrR family transcriptional regulator [Steroidobacteraceae bacterium]|nr:TetR/AcrR family transcriptional regulator [Steroidobacteraceae bacterium]
MSAPRQAAPARARRGEDAGRREQILRVSARLFREKGFDATSVRDIAAATGLQSGSWVYYFQTKQEILAAVMEEGLARSLQRIEDIARLELPPRDKFRALVRTHLDNVLGPGQDYIPVLLYEWRALAPAQRRRVVAPQKRYEQVWVEVIAELQARGEWLLPTPVDRLLMFGALNWMAHWYRSRGGLGMEELTEQCVRFFLRTAEPGVGRPQRSRGAAGGPRRPKR